MRRRGRVPPRRARLRNLRVEPWEQDPEGDASSEALEVDRAAVCLDDRLHDRQSEPRSAAAAAVCAREPFEDAVDVLGWDSGPSITHLDHGGVAVAAAGDGDRVAVLREL